MSEKLEQLLALLPDGELPSNTGNGLSIHKIKDDPELWAQLLNLRSMAEDICGSETYYHHGLLRALLVAKGKTAEPFLFRHVVGHGQEVTDDLFWERQAVAHRKKGKKYEVYRIVSETGPPTECGCKHCDSITS